MSGPTNSQDVPREWHQFVPMLIAEHAPKQVVEVGVWKGDLSEALMARCPTIERLSLVDPWQVAYVQLDDGRLAVQAPGCTQIEMDQAALTTAYKMGKYGNRVRIYRQPSIEAAKSFADESVDVVIVDGMHYANFVIQDITAWLRKLVAGGLMIGDDLGTFYTGVEVGVRAIFGDKYKAWGASDRATWWAHKENACLARV